ncbi:MAG: hypothetical protein JWO73_54 [Candidatus Taylorbacteria bacterium]|nr:hypothetical protein [Candidatus Taylorbacteria bacterium]
MAVIKSDARAYLWITIIMFALIFLLGVKYHNDLLRIREERSRSSQPHYQQNM